MKTIKLMGGTGASKLASRLVLISLFLFSFLTLTSGQVVGEEPMDIDEILRIMFPEAVIQVDLITNTLIVKAPPAIQEKIGEIIEGIEERLDVIDDFQITIEAKFVEIAVTDIAELGIDTDIVNIDAWGIDLDLETNWASDIDFPVESDAWGLWHTRLSPTAFQAVLRALEKHEKINVLSAPTVTTLNEQKATIRIIETIPYIETMEVEEGHLSWTIATREIGIFLDVVPSVARGSTLITLQHLRPRVVELIEQVDMFVGIGGVVPTDLGWPAVEERTTTTAMVIDSGETVVLGGLIRSEDRVIERRVPLLGDIPFLGHAFRHRHSRTEKKNLLIFITAYLVCPRGEKIVARR